MSKTLVALVVGASLAAPAFAQTATPAGKPSQPAVCGTCHQAAPANLRGYFESAALKSGAIQLNMGTGMEILRFDPATIRVTDAGASRPAAHLGKVRRGHEARVEYVEQEGVKVATAISFKGPVTMAPEKLASYADVEKLVGLGPETGGYTLIDSRPLAKFQEGTIPTAIHLPFPSFDKLVDRLPRDKSRLVVFFCQGLTCVMSPSSLKKAEALGYTNARVYREGWPEWTKRNYGVIAPAFVKEAFLDKGIPVVMLDAREAAETAKTGFVPGAVAFPRDAVKTVLTSFPEKSLKAPIMVYDAGGGEAIAAAKAIVAEGYENVLVVSGGIQAWQAAGYRLESGTPAVQVTYAPKPRPGSLAIEEFVRIAKATPADTLILDVRSRDEAKYGMIPGAINIPEEELLARMAELPAGKRIVVHCSSGVRAEMAYHKLKEKGFQAAFLNADIDIGRNGRFEVTTG